MQGSTFFFIMSLKYILNHQKRGQSGLFLGLASFARGPPWRGVGHETQDGGGGRRSF